MFVGVKMLTEGMVAERFGLSKETIITGSLSFVGLILLGSVAASVIWPRPPAEGQVEVQLPEGFDSPFDDDQGRLGGDERGVPETRQK
jgi:hypothetical protein